jgi:hypothetical protein
MVFMFQRMAVVGRREVSGTVEEGEEAVEGRAVTSAIAELAMVAVEGAQEAAEAEQERAEKAVVARSES